MPATIVGTANFDRIVGTEGNDVIVGLGGHDTIDGLGGNDIICGNTGSDIIDGGAGNDRIYGGYGNDVLIGGTGVDRLRGQWGNDKLAGTNGPDRLWGGSGNDTILGGVGRDKVAGGPGSDTCVTDGIDPATRSCEATDTSTYRNINVTPSGNGDDPTGSNFGDAYFAGGEVRADDARYSLPVSVKKMTDNGSIPMVVPTSGYLSITKDFPYEFVAIGGADINRSTPRNITVEMFCCALY